MNQAAAFGHLNQLDHQLQLVAEKTGSSGLLLLSRVSGI